MRTAPTILGQRRDNFSRLETLARQTPLAIIGYFALQLAVRLLLSSNLEIDESQFVGATDWAWGYGDSQPPLYNWLVRSGFSFRIR